VVRASADEIAEPESHALSVRRAPGKRALTLFVRSVSGQVTAENADRTLVLVLILNGGLHVRTTDSDLQQLYGFTAREARLATLLMDGSTLDESCYELGISRSTGCTHLRRLFKKTGVRRQSELAALLLKSVGLVRLASDANRSGSSALNREDVLAGDVRTDAFSPSLPA
jgi:DNA-binding CsgD family transcriptional regulator